MRIFFFPFLLKERYFNAVSLGSSCSCPASTYIYSFLLMSHVSANTGSAAPQDSAQPMGAQLHNDLQMLLLHKFREDPVVSVDCPIVGKNLEISSSKQLSKEHRASCLKCAVHCSCRNTYPHGPGYGSLGLLAWAPREGSKWAFCVDLGQLQQLPMAKIDF